MLLDPSGRLLDVADEPSFFGVRPGGRATRLIAFSPAMTGGSRYLVSDVDVGSEILVLARGCRPTTAPLTADESRIQMEAGFRLRLRVVGGRPTLPDGAAWGLTLWHRTKEVAGLQLSNAVDLRPIEAAAFDEDRPTHPQILRLPESGDLDVLMPVAGTYEVRGVVRYRNRSFSVGAPGVEITEGMRSVELAWPRALAERARTLVDEDR